MGHTGKALRGACLAASACALFACEAEAQTIRPVIVEYRANKIQGRFEVVNDGMTPLHAVLEPKSFDVTEDGQPVYKPLAPGIQLRLSAMSFRIPPRQSRTVFYEATAESLPRWFVIPCMLSGLPRRSGLEVRIELPHTVYMIQKSPLARADVQLRSCGYDPDRKIVELEIENRGGGFGRAIGAEVIGRRHRESLASFPLVPRARRRLRIPWKSDARPERVVVRFERFTVEQALAESVLVKE